MEAHKDDKEKHNLHDSTIVHRTRKKEQAKERRKIPQANCYESPQIIAAI